MKRRIDEATTQVTRFIPSSFRYGRWPRIPSKYHESYKAEENQKFVQWCLPYILKEVKDIPLHIFELGILLIDISHIFFNFTRDHGWSINDMKVARTLLSAWRVRSEESLGPNSSPLEHVAGKIYNYS